MIKLIKLLLCVIILLSSIAILLPMAILTWNWKEYGDLISSISDDLGHYLNWV